MRLWEAGEKVLVFCHYRTTGRALRRHISDLLNDRVLEMACEKLGALSREEAADELERLGKRFFDPDGALHRETDEMVRRLTAPFSQLSQEDLNDVEEVVRLFCARRRSCALSGPVRGRPGLGPPHRLRCRRHGAHFPAAEAG